MIPYNDTGTSFQNNTRFGKVQVETSSKPHQFTIYNKGNTELHLTGYPRVMIREKGTSYFKVIKEPDSVIQTLTVQLFLLCLVQKIPA